MIADLRASSFYHGPLRLHDRVCADHLSLRLLITLPTPEQFRTSYHIAVTIAHPHSPLARSERSFARMNVLRLLILSAAATGKDRQGLRGILYIRRWVVNAGPSLGPRRQVLPHPLTPPCQSMGCMVERNLGIVTDLTSHSLPSKTKFKHQLKMSTLSSDVRLIPTPAVIVWFTESYLDTSRRATETRKVQWRISGGRRKVGQDACQE